ncbi:MAG: leucine-rich repeat protein [Oscillospiraceae bacterium]|nr:leucine-rich repeat protein [Oscillospiraceae bacterium]
MQKRILSLFLAFALLCGLLPQMGLLAHAESYSGTCGAEGDGSNLTWTLDTDTGLLSIEGSGAMADYDSDGAPWYNYRETITAVDLPEGLTSIGDYAFYNCQALTSVTIPSSTKNIGTDAYSNCRTLVSVTIRYGMMWISESAFYECTSLASISLPASVIYVGPMAIGWYWNSQMNNYERVDGFTIYGYENTAVQGYAQQDGFNFVSLAQTPAEPGDPNTPSGNCGAGGDGSNLTWTLNLDTGLLTIEGIGAMGSYNYNDTPWADYHNAITAISLPDGLTSIGFCAFLGCSSLTSVTIPDSVTSISDYAFSDCSALTSVTIGNSVTSIGEYAFYGCSSLTSVTIPDSVTSISDHAFDGCSSLTSVMIGNSVTRIGNYAFEGCSSLTIVTIPDSVTNIGNKAFGWYYENGGYKRIDGFTIYGYEGTAAQTYAEENGFTFVSLISLPKIIEDPESVLIALGDTATFTVVASGENLSYQWQYKKPDGISWVNWSNKTSDTASVKAKSSNNGYLYRCVVSNEAGAVYSEPATLNAIARPVITSQPTSASVALGETASFTVVATGDELNYQWQYLRPNTDKWVDWSGKTSASVTAKATNANNGFQYRCIVSNEVDTVYSDIASLTVVVAARPVITTQPENASVMLGETASFTVVATGDDLSYQWQYKKPNSNSWVNWSGKTAASATAKATNVNNGYQYRCVVSNIAGSVASEAATLSLASEAATLAITAQPESVEVALGQTATFTVVATGENLSYKWQYKKPGSSTWTTWSGKTSASVTVKASNANNGWQYRCVVSNDTGSVTSEAAELTVGTATNGIRTEAA